MSKPLTKTELERTADIARAAAGIYEMAFQHAKVDYLAPRKGTLMHHLWMSKKLTLQQQRAWAHFTTDLWEANGHSGPIVGSYGESTGSRNGGDFKVPRAFVNHQYRRVEKLFMDLTKPEQVLLRDLMADEVRVNSVLELEQIGFYRSGYRNADQARSNGVAHIHCLLARIAAFYGVS